MKWKPLQVIEKDYWEFKRLASIKKMRLYEFFRELIKTYKEYEKGRNKKNT